MGRCSSCNRQDPRISDALGVCGLCLKQGVAAAVEHTTGVQHRSRAAFDLPLEPPRDGTVRCRLCANQCAIAEGHRGFCGLRACVRGKLVQLGGTLRTGILQWYYDPLPTNCVASWTCPAMGIGYPRYSMGAGPEYGWKNLAVFYESCTANCLFCQNWHYRRARPETVDPVTAEELASAVDSSTACICYFGGDPASQVGHALATSRIALRNNPGRILRICWETNGTMNRKSLQQACDLSLNSGGIIKFDLKCWSDSLCRALTGVSNAAVLENFAFAAGRFDDRPEVPLVVASTLLVPGYVDAQEVARIAAFIAALNPRIPYSLLGFHPDFLLSDLPRTSRAEAEAAVQAAHDAGLENVNVGNRHILS